MTAIAGETATENLRVQRMDPLPTPAQITREFPLSAPAADLVQRSRAGIPDLLAGRDDRLPVVAGPCSIHHPVAARDSAKRLATAAGRPKKDLLIVMRVNFENHPTT